MTTMLGIVELTSHLPGVCCFKYNLELSMPSNTRVQFILSSPKHLHNHCQCFHPTSPEICIKLHVHSLFLSQMHCKIATHYICDSKGHGKLACPLTLVNLWTLNSNDMLVLLYLQLVQITASVLNSVDTILLYTIKIKVKKENNTTWESQSLVNNKTISSRIPLNQSPNREGYTTTASLNN